MILDPETWHCDRFFKWVSAGGPNVCWDSTLTLRLLMSYIYGAPSKAKNANVVYIWT